MFSAWVAGRVVLLFDCGERTHKGESTFYRWSSSAGEGPTADSPQSPLLRLALSMCSVRSHGKTRQVISGFMTYKKPNISFAFEKAFAFMSFLK